MVRFCSYCKKNKNNKHFTKKQIKKPETIRRCRECMNKIDTLQLLKDLYDYDHNIVYFILNMINVDTNFNVLDKYGRPPRPSYNHWWDVRVNRWIPIDRNSEHYTPAIWSPNEPRDCYNRKPKPDLTIINTNRVDIIWDKYGDTWRLYKNKSYKIKRL